MSIRKIRVRNSDGVIREVRPLHEFARIIHGTRFEFAVTEQFAGVGYCVVHKPSGLQVCTVGEERAQPLMMLAQRCLTALIDRIGEQRVHAVLSDARPLPPVKFFAGWNIPGCMPEEPYAEFDTFEEARSYVADEVRRVIDDLLVQDCPRTAEQAEKALAWIERQTEPFAIEPISNYAYEVMRGE